VLICGGAGTGKTTMGLQFLVEGIEHGEPGAFVSVDEKPSHILADADRIGWELLPAIDSGLLTLLDASPFFTSLRSRNGSHHGIDVREVAADLVQEVSRIKARRLVVDSLTSLVPPTLPPAEAHVYLRALMQSLEDNAGCTTLLTCRSARACDPQAACQSARSLAAGVIELRLSRHGARFLRTLRIRKMRGTAVEPADYSYTIEKGWGLSLVDQASVGMLASASSL
jgi:circadian clock protein KaiC